MQPTAQFIATIALAAGLGASSVHAQTSTSAAPALPTPIEAGPVTVVNGGVDLDQAERMKRATGRYPLAVVFSVPGGNYAVPDEFTLMQGNDAMVSIPAAGPWLLIDLPAGTYTMQAKVDDRTLTRSVTVGNRAGNNIVYWQVPDSSSGN